MYVSISALLSAIGLGVLIALILHYPVLIHAADSKDVRRATFVRPSGGCYSLQPREVPCSIPGRRFFMSS